ncbi:MAG: Transcriptional regulator Crp/Fnr [Rhodospirillaceae bacterium]|nr:MAG: Transcriptional regulator Crp/Fnr [Rhodospirillaceae bacterium]TNC93353.1 MAG: Transcriptional regulator, Crp/Fnr family [Stygiobacter sp.]
MCDFKNTCDFTNDIGDARQKLPHIASLHLDGCPFPHAVARLYFDKGGYLFHQGDALRGAFHLNSGLVALERVDEDGRLVVLKVLRPGALFPCADLFAEIPHATTARALSDSRACFIPRERMLSAMADAATRPAVLRCCAQEARDSENAIFRLCSGDLSDQIIAALQTVLDERHEENGCLHGILPLCWRDLAAMVGTSPEVMSRTIRRLSKSGRLKVEGRAISLNPPRGEDRRRALARG